MYICGVFDVNAYYEYFYTVLIGIDDENIPMFVCVLCVCLETMCMKATPFLVDVLKCCLCSQEYQSVVDAEWSILYEKLEKIVASGAKIVLSKLPIGDVATQYFADR